LANVAIRTNIVEPSAQLVFVTDAGNGEKSRSRVHATTTSDRAGPVATSTRVHATTTSDRAGPVATGANAETGAATSADGGAGVARQSAANPRPGTRPGPGIAIRGPGHRHGVPLGWRAAAVPTEFAIR